MIRVTTCGVVCGVLYGVSVSGQSPPPPQPKPLARPPQVVTTNPADHPSPPQPHQDPSLEYFLGRWTFSWNGRESELGGGPRTGTTTFERTANARVASVRTEGVADAGGAYLESGTAEWRPAETKLAITEQLSNRITLSCLGDWSSSIAIRFECQPVTIGQTRLTLKRTLNIVSAGSFNVVDELSTNGGPMMRLGTAVFRKLPAAR